MVQRFFLYLVFLPGIFKNCIRGRKGKIFNITPDGFVTVSELNK